MTNEQLSFINKVADAAHKYSDYQILPSLTIAQAIKESNWGKSGLSKHFNFFGMKWNTKCGTKYVEMSTKEWDGTKYVTVKAKFRKYDSFEEGIKGYYDFITGYKRYKNLIGEKDPYTACKKIQADGWATSPTYATSLYNDYIVRYDLIKYDGIVQDPDVKPYYVRGKVYTTKVNLYIRKYPNGPKKKPYELTVNGKLNSYQDAQGNAVLREGTRITCMETILDGNSTWLLIPSGYICAVTSAGQVYIQ